MNRRLSLSTFFRLAILASVLSFGGCAAFSELDRSDLNHPLMDLDRGAVASSGRPLTRLGAARGRGAQATNGCSVCAH